MPKQILLASLLGFLLQGVALAAPDPELLRQKLKAVDPALRAEAISNVSFELNAGALKQLFPVLLESLSKDPADSVRQSAALAIGFLSKSAPQKVQAECAAKLADLLKNSAPSQQELILGLLSDSLSAVSPLSDQQWVEAVVATTKADDPQLQNGGFRLLLGSRNPLAAQPSVSYVQAHPGLDTGLALIAACADNPWLRDAAKPEIQKLLRANSSEERQGATQMLVASPELINLCKADLLILTDDPDSKIAALAAVGLLKANQSAPGAKVLARLLKSKKTEELESLVSLLESLPAEVLASQKAQIASVLQDPKTNLSVLLALLENPTLRSLLLQRIIAALGNPEERQVALLYLGSFKSSANSAKPILLGLIEREKEEAELLGLCQAYQLLGSHPTVLKTLNRLLSSREDQVGQQAFRLLLKDAALTPEMITELVKKPLSRTDYYSLQDKLSPTQKVAFALRLSASSEYEQRLLAVQALRDFAAQSSDARSKLEKLSSDTNPNVRLTAAEVLYSVNGDRRLFQIASQLLKEPSTADSALSNLRIMSRELSPTERSALRAPIQTLVKGGRNREYYLDSYFDLTQDLDATINEGMALLPESFPTLQKAGLGLVAERLTEPQILKLQDCLETLPETSKDLLTVRPENAVFQLIHALGPRAKPLIPALQRLVSSGPKEFSSQAAYLLAGLESKK